MSDQLSEYDEPKFTQPEAPQHEKFGIDETPQPEQPRQIAVTPGTLIIFKAASAGKQQLLAGKLLSGEGDTLRFSSDGSFYQVPLASVVQLLSNDEGSAAVLDPCVCRKALDVIEASIKSLRSQAAKAYLGDSDTSKEFFDDYSKASVSQHRLDTLKALLKLVNAL